ncbi:MAG: hypothetical protein Q4G25_02985 [Paracoccus sp. (in: a-proteobacteria)]|nr:hypothetical protein [Paracoccus sp. (in: a-proteobacteria)]
MNKISHIGIGLYQDKPTAAVVVEAGPDAPKAGDRFSLAGRTWVVLAAARYRGYEGEQLPADPDLVALVVENGDELVEKRDQLAGQSLTVIR